MVKLSKEELDKLNILERLELCICEVGIPSPIYIDPECPIHWDMVENDPDINKKLKG